MRLGVDHLSVVWHTKGLSQSNRTEKERTALPVAVQVRGWNAAVPLALNACTIWVYFLALDPTVKTVRY